MKDKIKEAVAERVQRHTLDTNWNVINPMEDGCLAEASVVSKLTTMVSIRTLAGPRFFEVIVKERY